MVDAGASMAGERPFFLDARPSMADAGPSMAGERPFFLDARPQDG